MGAKLRVLTPFCASTPHTDDCLLNGTAPNDVLNPKGRTLFKGLKPAPPRPNY